MGAWSGTLTRKKAPRRALRNKNPAIHFHAHNLDRYPHGRSTGSVCFHRPVIRGNVPAHIDASDRLNWPLLQSCKALRGRVSCLCILLELFQNQRIRVDLIVNRILILMIEQIHFRKWDQLAHGQNFVQLVRSFDPDSPHGQSPLVWVVLYAMNLNGC